MVTAPIPAPAIAVRKMKDNNNRQQEKGGMRPSLTEYHTISTVDAYSNVPSS
jgi:hypothetical protein